MLGLYFLNTSVDYTHLHSQAIQEDITVNHQESVVEIMVEKVLGFERFFPEHQDTTTDDEDIQTKVKVNYAWLSTSGSNGTELALHINGKWRAYCQPQSLKGHYLINTPPPEC